MTDTEVLGTAIGTPLSVAERMLRQYGGLRGLTKHTDAELATHVGKAKAKRLQAILEAGKRLASEPAGVKVHLNSSKAVVAHLRFRMRDLQRETFVVLCMSTNNRLLSEHILFVGTLNQSYVIPREIIKVALNENAASLVFVHNHPSGNPTPSPEDLAVTTRLKAICKVVDIEVNDHIIIGADDYFSFGDEGLL